MVGNIYIDGLIGSKIDSNGSVIEKGVELLDIILQVKNQPKAESFNVYINSPGGVVNSGFEIYDYLKSLGKPIKTIGQGMVASIATVIFMVGEQRELRQGTEFLIHLPSGGVQGNSDDINFYASKIKEVENRMLSFYEETTGLKQSELLPLLQKETILTDQEAFKLGFSNFKAEKFEPVAYFNETNTNKPTMSKKNDQSILSKILALFKEEGITNKIVFDAEQTPIDFYELSDTDPVAVGAKARVDGMDIQGEKVIPSEEDPSISKVYVFEAGVLSDIKDTEAVVEEDAAPEPDEMAALKEENETLKAKVLEFENSVTEKEASISNLTEKNKSLNSVISKIKALESEEEIVTGQREQTPKPETKNTSSSKFGAAITNLKNKKENGI